MDRFPAQFSDLLSARGRRILDRREPGLDTGLGDPARPFLAIDRALARRAASCAFSLLDRHFARLMTPLSAAIPPESITGQTRDHEERLRKTVRVKTAYLQRRGSRAFGAAERTGLIAMLRSQSFHAFAEALAGRRLAPLCGQQLLRYGAGDYAGPHTDHLPENPRARDGYIDIHLGFSHPDVAHHYLVHARAGHFTKMVDIAMAGGITAYRLPFWHYTTPLLAKPGREKTARRWVVLGSFYFA